MALRDQPYLPLYIKDIMTDEKLNECCAATHGIYIKGIMCLMHKSDPYGKILLKQKYKQNESKEMNFAIQLAKQLPYTVDEIFAAITELTVEDVCQFDGEYLVQKRMVSDGELSDKRAKAGKKGGENSHKNDDFAQAKSEANAEYENEYKGDDESKLLEGSNLSPKMIAIYKTEYPLTTIDLNNDFKHCVEIAKRIATTKGWQLGAIVNGKMDETLDVWRKVVQFTAKDNWFSTRTLRDLNTHNEWERLVKAMAAKPKKEEIKDRPTAPPLKRY